MKMIIAILMALATMQATGQTNETTRVDLDTPKLHPPITTTGIDPLGVRWRTQDFVSDPATVRYVRINSEGGTIDVRRLTITAQQLVIQLGKSYARSMTFPEGVTDEEKVALSRAEARLHLRKLSWAFERLMLNDAGDVEAPE